jgi:hypothetical protein
MTGASVGIGTRNAAREGIAIETRRHARAMRA